MKIRDVIYKVKIRMQELTPFGEGLSVVDTSGQPIPVTEGLIVLRPERYEKPIETYIKECMEESYKIIVELIPREYLPIKTDEKSKETAAKNQDGSGSILLPDDFYKLISFRMLGWERPVIESIDATGQKYKSQFNRFTRGGISRPICVVKKIDEKNKILEYFSLPEYYRTHKVMEFLYVPKLELQKDENGNIIVDDAIDEFGNVVINSGINIDSKFIEAYIYIVAAQVYNIYELYTQSTTMTQTALNLLGIKIKDKK